MKQLLVYIIAMTAVLVAGGCSRQTTYDRVLADADSIMEQHTDSAYSLLCDIADVLDNGDAASRARYVVLMTQAAYKLYEPTPYDSLMRQAVSHYEQAGNRPMLCRALYYRAMPLYEQGNHDEALLLLKKGEEIATAIHDVAQMSKYHESLCMVNDYAKCYDLMLRYAKLFLNDAISLKDTVLIARGFDHVSSSYIRLHQYQQAKEYMLETNSLLNQLDSVDRAYIFTNLGCAYHKDGDLNDAKHYLEQSLQNHPMTNTYAELGDVYADEGNMAEAERCWQKALVSDNPTTIVNTLKSIYRKYKQKQDDSNALAIFEQISYLKDSLNQASEKEKIAEIQAKYDQKVLSNRFCKKLNWALSAIVMALIVLLIIVVYHRRTVRTFTNTLQEKEETIITAQRRIDALMNSGEEHSEEIAMLQKLIASNRRQTNERLGIGKAVYDKIASGGSIHPTDDERCLIEYYSILKYETYAHWMNEYLPLTTGQIVLLILEDMGKNHSEVEQILHMSHAAYRTAKSRLNKRRRKESGH